MKKPLALIFGHKGGIGVATRDIFAKNNYNICPVDRTVINFESPHADRDIQLLLQNSNPDVIVNCAGNFINGYQNTHHVTMDVNFGSNWSIIKYYHTHRNKAVRIIMIGSSSYSSGKQLYPLYSASKAAVYNLWESSRDSFKDSPITVDLVNPVRTLTAMSTKGKQIDPTLDYLKPTQVAEQIFQLVLDKQVSRCINMTFKDAK